MDVVLLLTSWLWGNKLFMVRNRIGQHSVAGWEERRWREGSQEAISLNFIIVWDFSSTKQQLNSILQDMLLYLLLQVQDTCDVWSLICSG